MLKVGLTGGIGSGKTFVGDELAKLGCCVIRADELGHQVLSPSGEAYDPVTRHFGEAILNADGTIDRKRLASIVFGQPHELAVLNAFVHPAVQRREQELAAECAAKDPGAIVVVEAAILIETGSRGRFDRMILVECDERQQIDRAMLRHGADRQDIEARIARQMPLVEKRKYADYVISTCGTKQETLRQTQAVYESLRSLQA